MRAEDFEILREHMLAVIAAIAFGQRDAIGKSALDERVMTAMGEVPRHEFVPIELQPYAYANLPLPIGFEKTISQPFMCALMTDLLAPEQHETVLEVGTGLGYQTAILAELARHVWSVEIVEELADSAQTRLEKIGYINVNIRIGDGSRGWSQHAPYDKVLVAAAAEEVPSALLEQLNPTGRLVMPLGPAGTQILTIIDKDESGSVRRTAVMPVSFTRLETVM